MDATNLHPIQERILRRLGYDGERSFSALQGDLPSNKFAFHLNTLDDDGLIASTDDGYTLTADGVSLLPYLDAEADGQPLSLVALLLTADDHVYLDTPVEDGRTDPTTAFRRPPTTTAKRGVSVEERAASLYTDRFDGAAPELRLRGVFDRIIRFENGATHHHLLFHLGADDDGHDGDRWMVPSENDGVLPGIAEVVEEIRAAEGPVNGRWEMAYRHGDLVLDDLAFR